MADTVLEETILKMIRQQIAAENWQLVQSYLGILFLMVAQSDSEEIVEFCIRAAAECARQVTEVRDLHAQASPESTLCLLALVTEVATKRRRATATR